jgi:hypothetical protein
VTVELFDQDTPDVADFVITWLLPLGNTWAKHPIDDKTFPYRIVNPLVDADQLDGMTGESLVSVHTMHRTFGEAKAEAKRTHRRMLLLANNPSLNVVMPDGQTANADYLEVVQKPLHVDYGDTDTQRFVARYRVGFTYVTVS